MPNRGVGRGRWGGLGLCPEGTTERSPAFQRRVSGTIESVRPEGTVEYQDSAQSSLRDESPLSGFPGVETPGYCRVSLRDTPTGTQSGSEKI
jgi:hypothetical protein